MPGDEECNPDEIFSKLERALGNPEWSKWLNNTMQAFAVALTGVSERRMNDVVAALFLAQVGGSSYAALRLLGKSPEEALRGAEEDLCRIHAAAVRILRQSYEAGSLEENYRNALTMIKEGGEATRISGQSGTSKVSEAAGSDEGGPGEEEGDAGADKGAGKDNG